MTRFVVLAISGAFFVVQPAFASGEVVVYIMVIDAVLFIAAFLVITFILKCPRWIRAALLALYAVTELILYLLPVDLFRPAELNGPFHFALPAIVCAIMYFAYIKFCARSQHEAL